MTIRIAHSIALLLSIGAAAPSWARQSPADTETRVQMEVPAKHSAFLQAAGELSGTYTQRVTSFDSDGRVVRAITWRTEYVFQESDHRSRLVSTIEQSGTPTSTDVMVQNAGHSFHLAKDSTDQEFVLTSEGAASASGIAQNRWLAAAYYLVTTPLSDLISSKTGELRSVRPISIGGKEFVLVVCDRQYRKNDPPSPTWAVLDPSRQWAVVEYAQYLPWGVQHGWIEYSNELQDLALPSRLVERTDTNGGAIVSLNVVTFDKPKPTVAPASDFTLQAFGLEDRPR